jgi:hypothetical protein
MANRDFLIKMPLENYHFKYNWNFKHSKFWTDTLVEFINRIIVTFILQIIEYYELTRDSNQTKFVF